MVITETQTIVDQNIAVKINVDYRAYYLLFRCLLVVLA